MNPDAPRPMTIQNGLAVIDDNRYNLASTGVTSLCPTGVIVWADEARCAGAPAYQEREAS